MLASIDRLKQPDQRESERCGRICSLKPPQFDDPYRFIDQWHMHAEFEQVSGYIIFSRRILCILRCHMSLPEGSSHDQEVLRTCFPSCIRVARSHGIITEATWALRNYGHLEDPAKTWGPYQPVILRQLFFLHWLVRSCGNKILMFHPFSKAG